MGNNIFHSFLKQNILSLPIIIVYGTIRECGLELYAAVTSVFFVADYLDVGFSISAMSDYV